MGEAGAAPSVPTFEATAPASGWPDGPLPLPDFLLSGEKVSPDYAENFHTANPGLKRSEIIAHHGIEQQIAELYPGLVDAAMLHHPDNLRGIPKGLNRDLHLSQIRILWDAFNAPYKLAGSRPTLQDVVDLVDRIDRQFGHLYVPPVTGPVGRSGKLAS